MKRALIAVSFGTSVPEAEADILAVETALGQASPDRDFYRAYTSSVIRRILERRGTPAASPREVLTALQERGYQDVLIQPTHFLYGIEYTALRQTAEEFGPRFRILRLGRPLLCGTEQITALASVLLRRFSAPEEALVLMGHGTSHFSNVVYPAMQTALRISGGDTAFVATVEGWPTLTDILPQLRSSGLSKVLLVPMMLVAGDHAGSDMAGPQPGSWKSRLESEGFEVRCHMEGLGRLPEVQQMYVRLMEECADAL